LTSLEPLDLVIFSPVPRADGGASILSTRKCLYESVETVPFGGFLRRRSPSERK